MTREEREDAINFFKEVAKKEVGNYSKLAIEALEQQTCEDAISRQEAINCVTLNEFRYKIVEDIKTLPSVTPKEKTGHWIIKDGKEQGYDIAGVKTWYIQIMCDKCGFIKPAIEGHTGQYHFCPNCGAKIQEVEE